MAQREPRPPVCWGRRNALRGYRVDASQLPDLVQLFERVELFGLIVEPIEDGA